MHVFGEAINFIKFQLSVQNTAVMVFFWAFLRPAKPVKPASSKHGKQRMAFRRLVVRAACWMMSTPQYSQCKRHDFPSMEHAAHNEFGSPCQIASHNSMSRKKKERTLNPFFFQNATSMGSVSKETSWPKWVPNYWLCWLWIDSSSAWNGDTSLSVYLVYLRLRGIVATWIEGFWTQKIGSRVKPG